MCRARRPSLSILTPVRPGLRDRASDEVPRIQAQALRAAGVPGGAISIIPDEQEAIDAALRMGEPGDLLLIFADALVRSWKQITKFKESGAPYRVFRYPNLHGFANEDAREHDKLAAEIAWRRDLEWWNTYLRDAA